MSSEYGSATGGLVAKIRSCISAGLATGLFVASVFMPYSAVATDAASRLRDTRAVEQSPAGGIEPVLKLLESAINYCEREEYGNAVRQLEIAEEINDGMPASKRIPTAYALLAILFSQSSAKASGADDMDAAREDNDRAIGLYYKTVESVIKSDNMDDKSKTGIVKDTYRRIYELHFYAVELDIFQMKSACHKGEKRDADRLYKSAMRHLDHIARDFREHVSYDLAMIVFEKGLAKRINKYRSMVNQAYKAPK